METAEFKELLNRYRAGKATAEEEAWLESWYMDLGKTDKVLMDEAELKEARELIWKQFIAEHQVTAIKRRLWQPGMRLVAGIAAAVTAITLGIWLYNISGTSRHPEFISGSQYTNDVKPGKNTATITLANGKTINLSDAKTGVVVGDNLTYNDGSAVAFLSPSGRDGVAREGSNNNNPFSPQGGSLPGGERSRVQTLIASTPRGGTYQVTLPDGTKVWLNADSKISFPSQFSGKQRKILLVNGEVYFEVYKNKRMPFIVESKGQQVEVLGTHFNISAYKDESSTKTTLLEGSVRVAFLSPSASRSSLPRGEMALAREGNNTNRPSLSGGHLSQGERGANSQSIVLKPNQQATFLSPSGRDGVAREGKITVKEVNPLTAIDWKNGEFRFRNEPLTDILRKVARWYDVEIVYEGKQKELTFTGSVSRFDNVSAVLGMLEKAGDVKFTIAGKTIKVKQL